MVKLFVQEDLVIEQGDIDLSKVRDTNIKAVLITLNAQTFGLGNTKIWRFTAYYPSDRIFNITAPDLATYRETPRSILKPDQIKWLENPSSDVEEYLRPLLKVMPIGYTFQMLLEYMPDLIEENFPTLPLRRIAWDVPCRPIDEGYLWIHPEEARFLYSSELNALAGTCSSIHEIPQPIFQYIKQQVIFYNDNVWGKDDFSFEWCPNKGWVVKDCKDAVKHFYLKDYVPEHLPPCSRWEPKKKKRMF